MPDYCPDTVTQGFQALCFIVVVLADNCSVIGQLKYQVGVVPVHTIMGVQGVEPGTGHIILKSTRKEVRKEEMV